MNVHAAALAKAHRFDDRTSAFASDVIEGLTQQPKRLSPKYFYDAAGSALDPGSRMAMANGARALRRAGSDWAVVLVLLSVVVGLYVVL